MHFDFSSLALCERFIGLFSFSKRKLFIRFIYFGDGSWIQSAGDGSVFFL